MQGTKRIPTRGSLTGLKEPRGLSRVDVYSFVPSSYEERWRRFHHAKIGFLLRRARKTRDLDTMVGDKVDDRLEEKQDEMEEM
jgi:hypothetical protein